MHYFLRVFLLSCCLEWQNLKLVCVCDVISCFVHVLRNFSALISNSIGTNLDTNVWECLDVVAESSKLRFFFKWKQNEINFSNTKSNDTFCIKYRYMCFSYFLLCSVCYNFTQWTPICSFIHIHHALLFCINEILCCCFTSKPNVP